MALKIGKFEFDRMNKGVYEDSYSCDVAIVPDIIKHINERIHRMDVRDFRTVEGARLFRNTFQVYHVQDCTVVVQDICGNGLYGEITIINDNLKKREDTRKKLEEALV